MKGKTENILYEGIYYMREYIIYIVVRTTTAIAETERTFLELELHHCDFFDARTARFSDEQ